MFDDMPKSSPLRKILYSVLILAILATGGYLVYQKYFQKTETVKSAADKIINNIDYSTPAALPSTNPSSVPITTVSPS